MSGVRELHDLVSEYIQDIKEEDSFYTGFIDGKDAFETFFIHLRASGYWFVTKNSTLTAGTAGDHAKKGGVFFQNMRKGSNLQIPFFGALYEHVKNSHYECSQGKKRQHDRKERTLLPGKKRRVRLQPSKKIGCSASMTVWQISVFPQYKIDKYNIHGSEEQTKLAKKLKAHIVKGNKTDAPPGSQPTRYDRFVIRISTASVHNHPTLSCAKTQTLHPELSAEIGSLVKKNICTVREIQLYLDDFVQRKVEESVWPASERLNSCFYPNRTIIYNHMHKAIFELKEKKLDQEKFDHYVTNSIPPNDNIFFRPYREMRQEENNTCDETLLLVCHQTIWQKHLLRRYGNDICVLDTYKKTVYNLPLFFLVVKTNVGYSVAGSFIVQSVSSELVEDALRVFLSWNPDWDPLYFMTDLSKAEMSAIKNTFPESAMYLCAYYRERAWNHWLGLRDNEIPADTQKAFKRHWQEIAGSKTVSEFEENVMIMKNSDEYEQHPKVQKYMDKEWLSEAHYWVDTFHTEDFLTKLNFMNGVDSQSQLLNHKFLKQNSDMTLSELVHLVLTDYLPIVWDAYKIAQLTTKHEPLREDCPEFLANRPIHFVKHVMQRYIAALEEYSANNIAATTENRFAVTVGKAKNTYYFVDFDVPSCNCSDFAKWRFPCTHLCAVFLYVPNKSFKNLPKSYLHSPYLTVDEKLFKFEGSSELVPMFDNTVTIVEMDQSEIQETETIEMSPVKLEIEPIDEAEEIRELLKDIYNLTFLVGYNDQCLGRTKSKLLAAKLLLAEGMSLPCVTIEPPPLTRIIKTTDNHTSQCKRPTDESASEPKKVKMPDVQMAAVAQTSSVSLAEGSRKKCPRMRSWEGCSHMTKKVRVPNVQLAAVIRTDHEVVAEPPRESPQLTPSTGEDVTEDIQSVEHVKTSNQSVQKPSEVPPKVPPLLIRKDEVPNTLWVALARKRSQIDTGQQNKEENSSSLAGEVSIKEESD